MNSIADYLFAEIKKLKKELSVLLQAMSNDSNGIRQIEKDLALEKLRRIYELLSQTEVSPADQHVNLADAGDEQVPFKPIIDVREVYPDPVIEQQVPESDSEPDEESDSTEVQPETEEPVEEISDEPDTRSAESMDLFSSFNVTAETKSVAYENRIAEKETIADKIQKKKIMSLKEAIGINEKFYFLNELFGGTLGEYNAVIAHLDSLASFEEAENYIAELKEQYNWDTELEALIHLTQFVERKLK